MSSSSRPADTCNRAPDDQNSPTHTLAHTLLNALLHPFLLCSAVLTGLTSLQLPGFGAAVDNAVALGLAASLRNLQHLDLRGCDCKSRELVQKLQRLPMLRELLLDVNAGEFWPADSALGATAWSDSSRLQWAVQAGQLHGPGGFREL